ncbi:MAG: ribokinase [Leptolyngbya sp. DLM2.Bin15]|nr:MAG: ribokinase [Leptolyngbya sp. DLM2.Bin15]
MDLVTRCDRFPQPGETLVGRDFTTVPGGKGANQAVAAARLGVPTELVGRVGQDDLGRSLLAGLQQAGVGCDGVTVDRDSASGVAAIAVDGRGENQIVIVPGANGQVETADVQRLATYLPQAGVLLLQLEVPLPAVVSAAQIAHSMGVRVILDPAPAQALPTDLFPLLHCITPNQVEAGQLVGFPVGDRASAQQAGEVLVKRGVAIAIVKLGEQGAIAVTADQVWVQPAFSVPVVDTVAAGDAFNGGLAMAMVQGQPLPDALRWATAIAALSVTQAGAQPSMPTRSAVEAFLADPPPTIATSSNQALIYGNSSIRLS